MLLRDGYTQPRELKKNGSNNFRGFFMLVSNMNNTRVKEALFLLVL